ncbi:hypothetical protein Pcinc_016411 [Petrolisthes cinctipes]|uniref:Echinoderm microtubule-associated protein-like 5 n=1 Tax=Petrolisthes cinctipes TaxID=88211 RepID=A0AAE1FR49_PETCI|nr:hypothetical protein Pcinc_016411 [Petrolisthes cinctipes]
MGTRRAPEGWLTLKWVFGYNGHTARNNVRVTRAGHLLYYVAGVGVVHDTTNARQVFYTGHDDDITSLAVCGDGETVATGQVGRDAYITVWDASTCHTISVLRDGHNNKVSSLAFTTDTKRLASTGGNDHKQELIVWNWRKGRRLAHTIAYLGKVEELEWEPGSSSRLVSCGHNHVKFWKLSGNVLQSQSGVFGSEKVTSQVSISHMVDGRVVTGGEAGHLYIWEKARLVSTVKDIHPGGVLVTEVYPGGLITGGRDGKITIFDRHLNKVSSVQGEGARACVIPYKPPSLVYDTPGSVHSLAVHHDKVIVGTEKNEVWTMTLGHEGGFQATCVVQGHGVGEVWGLATHPTRLLALTASDDRTIRLWDIEGHVQLSTRIVSHKARSAAFAPDGQHVAVGLIHGAFLVLTADKLDEKYNVKDRKEVRHDLKYSPCGKLLAVASNDNFVDVYNVEMEYKRLYVLSGASSFITHLDWSQDSNFIQLNSGASERLIYDVTKESIVDESDIEGLEWATWTGVLGKAVAGIWHKYADVSDVNTCDANFHSGVVVTGDDYGLVKLFRFPCTKRGAKPRSFVGHSAHVTNVRWTSDGQHVVSVGGADHGVFVWKFLSRRTESPPLERVQVPARVDGESDDEVLDTEDELEGIPELTIDLEGDLTTSTRRRRKKKGERDSGVLKGVEVADDSTFAKRRNAKTTDQHHPNIPPQHGFHMKHIFGVRSQDSLNNAHILANGCVVYPVAAVGVVLDVVTNKQQHYLHHTDDILCLTLDSGGKMVATGQQGRDATIHVWEGESVRILSLLKGGHSRGVAAVAFSGDGQRLASLGLDDHHTLVVWNWRKGYKIATARSHGNRVFGVVMSPWSAAQVVTFGVKHIKFWTQAGGGLTYRQVVLGNKFKQSTVLCASVGGKEERGTGEWWVFGESTGHVLVVRDGKVERSVKAHKVPIYTILTTPQNVWTGGQDGLLCRWDREVNTCVKSYHVTDRHLEDFTTITLTSSQPGIRGLASLNHHSNNGEPTLGKVTPLVEQHSVSAIDAGSVSKDDEVNQSAEKSDSGEAIDNIEPDTPLLVFTQHAELLRMNKNGKFTILVQGHSKGEVWGLDTHPQLLEAVTVGGDNTLRRWDIGDMMALKTANLRKAARCLHFHPTAPILAIGFLDGSIGLYLYPSLEKHGGVHHRTSAITDIRFSPSGRLLGVASQEGVVDLYVVDTDGDSVNKEGSGLRRVGVCRGSSSRVTHITWHQDSRLLQLNSEAGEELFYLAPHGTRQLIPDSARPDLNWSSPLTCPLDMSTGGIWSPGDDLSDINAIATANKLPLVAAACDDQGLLRLYRYPCEGSPKKYRQYRGHSSHVTNVRWSFDDTLLVTTGGADMSVVVWQFRQRGREAETDGGKDREEDEISLLDDLPEEELTITDLEATGLEGDHLPINLLSITTTPIPATTTTRPTTTRPTTRPRTRPSPPTAKNAVTLRNGMYTHATRLHKSNTSNTRNTTQAPGGNNNLISKHPMRTLGQVHKRLLPQLAGTSQPTTRLRSLPTLAQDDTTVFYCSGSLVGRLNLVQGRVEGHKMGYGDHTAAVTCLALYPGDPMVVATAQLGTLEHEKNEGDDDYGALVHVWRCRDGVGLGLLRGGGERVVTALSFSPSSRFLASLADGDTIHIFNWIKGVHVAETELGAGLLLDMGHCGETTLAVLTPRILLFLDLVGNSLLTTRAYHPSGLPDGVAYSTLSISPNGNVLVGCSNCTVVLFKGRAAIRDIPAPADPPISPPIRLASAYGHGAAFVAVRVGNQILVRCYITEDEKQDFLSDSRIAAPSQDWTPLTARLGGSMLILGARRNQPFIALNLTTGKFTLIEHG